MLRVDILFIPKHAGPPVPSSLRNRALRSTYVAFTTQLVEHRMHLANLSPSSRDCFARTTLILDAVWSTSSRLVALRLKLSFGCFNSLCGLFCWLAALGCTGHVMPTLLSVAACNDANFDQSMDGQGHHSEEGVGKLVVGLTPVPHQEVHERREGKRCPLSPMVATSRTMS